MLYLYPTPKYPRTTLEATMKSVYALSNATAAVAMVVLITEYFVFLQNCMPKYYTDQDLVLADSLEFVLEGCSYTGTVHLMNVRTTVTVNREGIIMALMQCAQYITALFSLLFVTLIVNAISASLYRAGDRHIRLCGVHISIYHAMVALSYFINFTTIGTTFSYDTQRKFYLAALDHCAASLKEKDVKAYYQSEYTGYTILSVAVYWPISSACANLLIFFIGFVVRCLNSNHKADILLSQADVPWEKRGFSCSTSKPLLRLHTTQRNAIVEEANAAMKQGMEVRIVRSYQLLTESDYQDLVQAMQEQVDENLREEQFELLRQNFGEDESAWDQSGFMWHDNLPWALPTPLDSSGDGEEEEMSLSSVESFGDRDPEALDEAQSWSPSEEPHLDRGDGFAGFDNAFDGDQPPRSEAEGDGVRRHRRHLRRARYENDLDHPEPLDSPLDLDTAREPQRMRQRRRERTFGDGEADELSDFV